MRQRKSRKERRGSRKHQNKNHLNSQRYLIRGKLKSFDWTLDLAEREIRIKNARLFHQMTDISKFDANCYILYNLFFHNRGV